MTQDEVDLIYDYLHENYLYEDGELIVKKTRRGFLKIGTSIGSIALKRCTGRLFTYCSLTVNNKRKSMQLKHVIYIYHHKIKPRNIRFIDNNPANHRIENLKAEKTLNLFILTSDNYKANKGISTYKSKNKIKFRVRLPTEEGRITIGSYDVESIAIKCYSLAMKLYLHGKLTKEQIKEKVIKKYPANEHKKVKLKGVTLSSNKRYKAILIINKVRTFHGTYGTPEEAHKAYLKAHEAYIKDKTELNK
jgi:hypothetical protein